MSKYDTDPQLIRAYEEEKNLVSTMDIQQCLKRKRELYKRLQPWDRGCEFRGEPYYNDQLLRRQINAVKNRLRALGYEVSRKYRGLDGHPFFTLDEIIARYTGRVSDESSIV